MKANGIQERVVVTGMGTVNALAGGVPRFAEALRRGECGIRPITLFDTAGFRTENGAQVKDFIPRVAIPARFSLKRMSRSDIFALAAALQALVQAGLDPVPEALREEMGVVIGGGAGASSKPRIFSGTISGAGRAQPAFPASPRSAVPPAPTTWRRPSTSGGPRQPS